MFLTERYFYTKRRRLYVSFYSLLLTCSSMPRLSGLKLQETDADFSVTGWLDLKVHLSRTDVPLTAVSSLGVDTSMAKT